MKKSLFIVILTIFCFHFLPFLKHRLSNWKCRSATIHVPAGVNETVCTAILMLWEMLLWHTVSKYILIIGHSQDLSVIIGHNQDWSLSLVWCPQHPVSDLFMTEKTVVFKRTSENWNIISCFFRLQFLFTEKNMALSKLETCWSHGVSLSDSTLSALGAHQKLNPWGFKRMAAFFEVSFKVTRLDY